MSVASATTPAVQRLMAVRLVISDVDGVMTDGRLAFSDTGDAQHVFHVRDGLALVRAARAGLPVAVISGRRCAQVARRLRELRVRHVAQGIEDKAVALASLCTRLGIAPEHACYVGDDVNDIPALRMVGLPVAVADAAPETMKAVRERNGWVLDAKGGAGALREIIVPLLEARGAWLLPGEQSA